MNGTTLQAGAPRGMIPVLFCMVLAVFTGTVRAGDVVTVNLDHELQTMEGTGGNAYGFITGSKWSPQVLDLILNDLTVDQIRFRSAINQWEPYNDNGDPNSINWSAFKDEKSVHEDFVLLQKLTQAGVKCNLGIWEVPDWMVLNPGANNNRIIPPDKYPEFAEMVVSYILYAKSHYGADIQYLSIQNEPNIGWYNYFSASELADAAEVLIDYLDAYGLGSIQLHVGDVNEPVAAIPYSEASLDRPAIAARAAAVSFHTWHNMSPSVLENVRDLAQEYGVGCWATEVGTSPLDSTTMDWALGSMKNHLLAIKYAHCTMTFQWTLGGPETSISKYGQPYPVYHALKHLHHHVEPGSVCVETTGDTSTLYTTAFVYKPEKRVDVVVVDTDTYAQDVTFQLQTQHCGFWPLEVYKTTQSLDYAHQGQVSVGPSGAFTYNLEGRSFHTFSGRYNHLPQLTLLKENSPGNPGFVDYVFTLSDADGIVEDMKVAGVGFFLGGTEILSLLYDDPNPPPSFQVEIDPSGTVLVMRILGFPKHLGLTMIGGGADVDGGMAFKVLDI